MNFDFMFEKDHKDTPCVIFTNNANDTFVDAIAIYEIVQIQHMMYPFHQMMYPVQPTAKLRYGSNNKTRLSFWTNK